MTAGKAPTVAVVGLGAIGLVTMKNLLEEGFDVTGFDRNEYLGGLWHYDERARISVLESTVSNGSKHRGCFTDFPFPNYMPDFPVAADVEKYLLMYTKQFQLESRTRLNTTVFRANWSEERKQWELEMSSGSTPRFYEYFDKVVISLGPDQVPNIPSIPGIEKFQGDVQHSIGFKKPEHWTGKRVLIIGFGNTAADISGVLVGKAEKIYLSHRSGAIVLPRWVQGKPVDHVRTYRKYGFLTTLNKWAPSYWEKIMNSFILKLRNETYDLRPEWGFDPAPQVNQSRPIVSDNLVENMASGNVKSCVDVKSVVDGKTVEFADGTQVDVDAIIYCTGYRVDYSIVGDADPSCTREKAYQGLDVVAEESLPRLYQNIFSLAHPDSLAFMGNLSFMNPAFLMFDLATMALAQVWKGKTKLPPKEELNRAVDEHHQWILRLKAKGPVVPGLVNAVQWMDWVEEAAGLGLKEHLGYGPKGWYFWLTNRKFCSVLMDGLMTPIHYRVFPGSKRKYWDGAREAILSMHEDLTSRKW